MTHNSSPAPKLRLLGAAVCLALLGAAPAPSLHAEPAAAVRRAVSPAAVLEVMQQAADWQLSHPSTHPEDDWTQGVGEAGMMALAGISGERRYRDAMIAMGERNHWRLGPSIFHADDYVVGQTYAELYLMTREPKMIAPMRQQFDFMLENPRNGSLWWKRRASRTVRRGATRCSWGLRPGRACTPPRATSAISISR
ncbi:glycoside hydrolase family 88 protein [Pseudoduganella sp. UC29_106]|uniref:glycoside hydrolase family 88 protein n=1 Tax=Pseudoduganella sp. UC29_106 TaxID=3374553 RepID=UPI0037578FFA